MARQHEQRPAAQKDRTMKYTTLLLAAALMLAAIPLRSTAQAQAQLNQCSLNYYKAHLNGPPSRWKNHMQKVAAAAPYSSERMRLKNSTEGRALIRAASRYCNVPAGL
jgi:hypothetical protein